MTSPFPPRTVPKGKITQYLLDPTHKKGGPKSVFFRAFGFSADDVATITASLTAHPDLHPIETTSVDQWGTTLTVLCNVQTPDGRNPCIRTVWQVRNGETDAQFVTAYPG